MSRIWNREMVDEMLDVEVRSIEELPLAGQVFMESRVRSMMRHRHGVDDAVVSWEDVQTTFDRALYQHVAIWRPVDRPGIYLQPGPLFGHELWVVHLDDGRPGTTLRTRTPSRPDRRFDLTMEDEPQTLMLELAGWDPDRRAWLYV